MYVNERKKHVILDGQQRVTSLFLYFNDLWYVGADGFRRLDFKSIDEKNAALRDKEYELIQLKNSKDISKKELSDKLKTIKEDIKALTSDLKCLGVVRVKYFVKDGESEKEISYNSFSEDEKEFLKRKRLDTTIVECRSNNAPKVYSDIFRLLNSGGKQLSSQEIRNGVYWELELYDELFRVNTIKKWREIYGKESDVAKDIEILLKILALNYFTIIKEDKIKIEYEGTFNWSNIMEDYSSKSANWGHEEILEQIKLLTYFLEKIININKKENKCNKAVFEASFVVYTKLKIKDDIDYMWLCGLEKEKEFQKGEVLSNKQSVENRLTKALCLFREKYGVLDK